MCIFCILIFLEKAFNMNKMKYFSFAAEWLSSVKSEELDDDLTVLDEIVENNITKFSQNLKSKDDGENMKHKLKYVGRLYF